jgi:hypothetical protein
MVEVGLAGAQDLKLVTERDVVQLLHISHPLVDLAHACNEVLLLLDVGTGTGLD